MIWYDTNITGYVGITLLDIVYIDRLLEGQAGRLPSVLCYYTLHTCVVLDKTITLSVPIASLRSPSLEIVSRA